MPDRVPDRSPDRPPSQAFGRTGRLRRRADYVAVQEQGRRFSGRFYLLLARRQDPPGRARFGVTVSRKVGGSVQRNRVKRWVRESYRRLQALAPAGTDLVLIARPAALTSGLAATTAELETLLRRLGRD